MSCAEVASDTQCAWPASHTSSRRASSLERCSYDRRFLFAPGRPPDVSNTDACAPWVPAVLSTIDFVARLALRTTVSTGRHFLRMPKTNVDASYGGCDHDRSHEGCANPHDSSSGRRFGELGGCLHLDLLCRA
jgi:hypothetical protein